MPLESGETIHVRPAAFVDEEKGYDRAEVLDRLLKTDVAILAALAVLEGGEGPTAHKGEPEIELLYAAYDLRTPREGEERLELAKAGLRFRWERVLNLTEAQLRRNKKNFKKLEDDERAKLVKANAKRALRESERPLDLAEAEVRFYREDFEMLSDRERRTLVVDAAARIHEIAKAAREHAEYLERGRVRNRTTRAWVYVRAAEMKDIEGLGDREIGKRLGIEQSVSEKADERSDLSNVRRAVAEGRKLLDKVHDGRWQAHAAEQKRRAGIE